MGAELPTRIRRAGPTDAGALALVGGASFLETYAGIVDGPDIVAHCAREHSPQRYAEFLADSASALWVVETAARHAVVGYMVCGPAALPVADQRPDDREIRRIYLLASLQGHGCGRRLVEEARAWAHAVGARRLLLGVYRRNERAVAFYRRMGFEIAGERKFRVGAHEYDDHVMALPLA